LPSLKRSEKLDRTRFVVNPSRPPIDADQALAPGGFAYPSVLASRSARLGGALIDGCFTIAAAMPLVMGAMEADPQPEAPVNNLLDIGMPAYVTIALWVCLFGVQAVLITRRGQSIGKIIARTRILRTDGRPAGFIRGVLLRSWVFVALQWTPLPQALLSALLMLDGFFIVGNDRRCLHDWLAGTHVVQTFGSA